MGHAQLFCTQALLGAMIALRLTLLATAAFAAPAAEADADPQFLLGHGLAYAAPLVHHVVPVCKIVVETVVVGQRCHAEPDCTTEPVVVGRHITGHEEPPSTVCPAPPLSRTSPMMLPSVSPRACASMSRLRFPRPSVETPLLRPRLSRGLRRAFSCMGPQ